jgi:signal transduction histidine kinase
MGKAGSMKTKHLWALILLIYVAGVAAYSAYSYEQARQALLVSIDRELTTGAIAVAKIAGPKFHEGLHGPESRSEAELRALAADLTAYSRAANLIYIYSVIQRSGKPFFAAASVGYDNEWNSDSWNSFFRPYLEPPEELLQTLEDGQTRFAEYKDEYGTFRSIFMSWKTSDGEIWVTGADIKTDEIRQLLHRSIIHSFGLLLYFLLLAIPVALIYMRIIRKDRDLLEKTVEQRTGELARVNQQLQAQAAELEGSNRELEQYAYVASHDLREPLRMVTSYLTLIERKLGAELSEDVKTYIGFAVDGAKRMDVMIRDLLEYSRVGKSGSELKAVDLAKVVEETLFNLKDVIETARAEITVASNLPVVVGNPVELGRLFQNLLGNAIKYRATGRPPKIAIDVKETDKERIFRIEDNGIGIAPAHLERVFGIFQRLVPKGTYEGTGIGLAVCRKIVEHHGGRIWVESAGEDKGSCFCFTLLG